MLDTPYGHIKILIGPNYQKKAVNEMEEQEKLKTKSVVDYSKEAFEQKPADHEGEILAEDYQEPEMTVKAIINEEPQPQLSLAMQPINYDQIMAIAPAESYLNRYPLAPPKFAGYTQSRNSNKQLVNGNFNFNPAAAALYYQNYPVNDPYNYPYSNLQFPPPMYFGY